MVNRHFSILMLFLLAILFMGCNQNQSVSIDTEPSGFPISSNGKNIGKSPVKVDCGASVTINCSNTERPSKRSTDQAPITKTLTAAYLPLTANLPLFVALENGYFEENGIKVKAIEATSPNDIVTGLVSGNIDFAAVLAYSIIFPAAVRFPDSFKLYSSSEETLDHFTSSILVKKDSPITDYKQLKGKKIGVYTGLVQLNFLKAILSGMDIDFNSVDIVQISPRLQVQGLVNDDYVALSSTEPTTTVAQVRGIARVLSENPRVKYIMNPFPSTAATISTKLLSSDPQSAQAVIKALEMAIDFINENPTEAKKTLLKYTAIPKDIGAEVLAELKLFKYCKLGEENRLNVQRFADFLFEAGIMKQRIPDVNVLFGDSVTAQ